MSEGSLITRGRVLGAALLLIPLAAAVAAGAGGDRECGHHGPPTVEEARAHAGTAADFALYRVDGTEAQRAAVDKTLDVVVPRMHDTHAAIHELHEEAREILTAEQIDREALEGVRQDAVSLIDRTSAAMLDQLVDLAQQFTPEQREKLGSFRPPRPHGDRPHGDRP